jgi:hypothetical protein
LLTVNQSTLDPALRDELTTASPVYVDGDVPAAGLQIRN